MHQTRQKAKREYLLVVFVRVNVSATCTRLKQTADRESRRAVVLANVKPGTLNGPIQE